MGSRQQVRTAAQSALSQNGHVTNRRAPRLHGVKPPSPAPPHPARRTHDPAAAAAIGMAAGVALADALSAGAARWLAILAWLLAAAAIPGVRNALRIPRAPAAIAAPLLGFLAFGLARHPPVIAPKAAALDLADGALIEVRGRVGATPLPGRAGAATTTIALPIVDATLALGGPPLAVRGIVMALIPRDGEVLWRGSGVRLLGRFVPTPGQRNPGGIDRKHEALRAGIALTVACPDRALIATMTPAPPGLRLWLDRVRVSVRRHIDQHLRPAIAALVAALVLGDRSDLDADVRDAAAATGLLHLIAISGLHIALVVGCVRALLGVLLHPRAADLLAIALALAYAAIAGAGTPILRAAIGTTLVLIGRCIGRRPQRFTAISLAVVLLLALDPAELFRPGFQLSFAAVFGLLTAPRAPPADRAFGRYVVAPLRISLRAALFTAPLLLVHFGVVNPLGPVLTVLCTPLFLLAFGLAVAFAFVGPWLPGASLLATPTDLACSALTAFFSWGRDLPGANLMLPRPHPLGMLCLCAAIAWRRHPGRAAGMATVTGLLLYWQFRPPTDSELWLLDVGHGQAAVLRAAMGGAVLFDAGSRGLPDLGTRVLIPALDALGVAHLDLAAVSHGDADHTNGLAALLEAGRIRAVTSDPSLEASATNRAWQQIAAAHHTPTDAPLIWPGAPRPDPRLPRLTRLSRADTRGSDNDRSVVVLVEVDGVRVLLPGDIEDPGIRELLAHHPDLTCDILVLPHHGNPTVWLGPLLHRTRPRLVLASRREAFADEVVKLCARSGAEMLSTATHGAICVRIRNDGTWRAERFPWHPHNPRLPGFLRRLTIGR